MGCKVLRSNTHLQHQAAMHVSMFVVHALGIEFAVWDCLLHSFDSSCLVQGLLCFACH